MFGNFSKCAGPKLDGKPGHECSGLGGLAAAALGTKRALGETITRAHVGYDLFERRGLAYCFMLGKHLLQEVFLPDHPTICLSAVEHLRVAVTRAGIDKGRKALPCGIQLISELTQDPVGRQPLQDFLSEIGAMTAPGIAPWLADHSGPHRIEMEITYQRQPISVVIHQKGFEAPLEHVSDPVESGVQMAGVAEGKILHAGRQARFPRLKRQMQVIGHQAKGVNSVTETLHAFGEEIIEVPSICVSQEDVLTRIATQDDVVQTTGGMKSGFSSHKGSIHEHYAIMQA